MASFQRFDGEKYGAGHWIGAQQLKKMCDTLDATSL